MNELNIDIEKLIEIAQANNEFLEKLILKVDILDAKVTKIYNWTEVVSSKNNIDLDY